MHRHDQTFYKNIYLRSQVFRNQLNTVTDNFTYMSGKVLRGKCCIAWELASYNKTIVN